MIKDVILASTSPRREELLAATGLRHTVMAPHANEELEEGMKGDPYTCSEILAQRKAAAVIERLLDHRKLLGQTTVIGADTMVFMDGIIYGKPKFAEDAKRMLRELSGRTHEVITGVAVWRILAKDPKKISLAHSEFHEVSRVTFRDLIEEEIAEYVASGESFDKAGAYGIQGKGADLVESYDGAYDNIVGLPVERLFERFPDLADQAEDDQRISGHLESGKGESE